MKRLLSLLLGGGLLVLVAGCGQTPGLTVKLDVNAVSIVRGDQGMVAITVNQSGSAGPVSLAVTGVPANVSAVIDPPNLAAGATSAILRFDVGAAAAEGTTNLTISAISGNLAARADLTLDITSLTVNGTVQGLLGEGFPGAKVAIQGNTATTDANGHFSISEVSLPYDVAVGATALTVNSGHLFVGMTSAEPVLAPYGALMGSLVPGYYPAAVVNGDLDSPVPVNSMAKVCLEGTSGAVYGCTTLNPGQTAYSIPAMWVVGNAVSFTVHALVIQVDSDYIPTGYSGYGSAVGSVASGGTTIVNVALGAAPATNTVTLSVNPPAGFDRYTFSASSKLSPTFTFSLFESNPVSSSTISLPMPQFPGATYSAAVTATPSSSGGISAAWKQVPAPGGTVTFDLSAPPSLVAPGDGATGIGVGDSLRILGTNGSPVTFLMSTPSFDNHVLVTTMDDSATVPDLTSVGVPLLAASSYTWSAYLSPTSDSMEEASQYWLTDYYDAVLVPSMLGGPGARLAEGTILGTDSRDLTTP